MRIRAMHDPKHIRRDLTEGLRSPMRYMRLDEVRHRPRAIARDAAIAEGLADAREYTDMDAIAHDGFRLFTREQTWEEEFASKGTTVCDMAEFMPAYDARDCGCHDCDWMRTNLRWSMEDEVVVQVIDEFIAFMSEAPNGAPVVPEGWREAMYAL